MWNWIGAYALIGAGSVVTKNVPPYALLLGNPGKLIGWVSEYGHKLEFVEKTAFCKESQQEYFIDNNIVRRIKWAV